jgi:hypothetical protein
MSGSGWMPLVVGLIAASVALTGYVMTQAANRRRQKAKLFAEAIEAVKAFEEVPYRIAKRAASGGPTRADLGNRVSDLSSSWVCTGPGCRSSHLWRARPTCCCSTAPTRRWHRTARRPGRGRSTSGTRRRRTRKVVDHFGATQEHLPYSTRAARFAAVSPHAPR